MSAVFSPCGRYRYALWRYEGGLFGEDARFALFVMLNPSTADGMVDDPTVRRCRRFAMRMGFSTTAVVNLYGLRSTDPRGLADVPDPIGPKNDEWIDDLASRASRIIVAWGADEGPVPGRADAVLERLRAHREVEALGLTASGAPRHPLYLRRDVEPVAYV